MAVEVACIPSRVIGQESQEKAPVKLTRSIGTSQIIFFVVAAAAPLVSMLGAAPMAIAHGNGPGMPAAFLAAGLLLILFSVGYTAMSRHVVAGGGFFTYIAIGLGPAMGVGAALLAVLSYTAIQAAVYGLLGYFAVEIINPLTGWTLPWYVFVFAALAIVHFFGARSIELSGLFLGILMAMEAGILLVLAGAIILSGGGPDGLSLAPISPSRLLGGGAVVAIIFALLSFTGFEATAIYAEEARNPETSVPRATYGAVVIITLFYTFTGWAIIYGWGNAEAVRVATERPGELFLTKSIELLGAGPTLLMRLLMLSSILSTALAFQNTMARYLMTLARAGLLPPKLAEIHLRFASPFQAGRAQTAVMAAIILAFVTAGADPYAVQYAWMGALGTLGLVVLQALVSVAVIGFFKKARRGEGHWHASVAPALAAIGLGFAAWQIALHLPLLSGAENIVVRSFPWLVAGSVAVGFACAPLLKRWRPENYRRLELICVQTQDT